MPQYVVTPWKTTADLLKVRAELYSDDDADRRHAIDWVAAWRMRGALPHAIDSTAAIVDAQLHRDASKNSSFSIRATYAAAVSRFVTGYCDITQTSSVRRSMFDVANEIGLPPSFVELRHEATHSDLPSLQRLERHAAMALEWLWTDYWVKLDLLKGAKASPQELAAEAQRVTPEIAAMVSRFTVDRRKEMRLDPSAESQASRDAAKALISTMLGRRACLEVLANQLCRPKALIPAERAVGVSMKGAFLLWDTLLAYLHGYQHRFLGVLLKTLTTRLVEADGRNLDTDLSGFEDGLYQWVVHLLTGPEWSPCTSRKVVWDVLTDVMLSQPNGVRLAQDLLDRRRDATLSKAFGYVLTRPSAGIVDADHQFAPASTT